MTRTTTPHTGHDTTKNPQTASHAAEQDAIALLMDEHRKVQGMFEQFKTLKEEGDNEKIKALVDECCTALKIHTAIEEEIFYPAMREALEDKDMMDEAIVEHASAKQFIAQINRMQPDDDLYDAMFTVLGEYVNHHIEEEENEMFKKAKKSKADLHMLADAMEQRRSQLKEQLSPQAQGQGKEGKRKHLH